MAPLALLGKRVIAFALVPALSACANFGVYNPTDNAVLDGSMVSVDIKGGPNMSGLKVSLDGTDITSSLEAMSDSEYQSKDPGLQVTSGRHVLVAEADIYCWYCSPTTWHDSISHTFCTGGATNIDSYSRTASSKNDLKGWSNNGNATVNVADNSSPSTSLTQWDMLLQAGYGSFGLIKSVNNRCVCMASAAEKDDTPIALKVCDSQDTAQQWYAEPSGTAHFHLIKNKRNVLNIVCLKEGSGNLVQHACDATDSLQLWSFFDLTEGLSGVDPF